MNATTSSPVPPKSLDQAIAFVRAGGRLYFTTYTRATVIDARTLARFEREWVLSHTHEICHAWPCSISACGSICSFGSSCGFRGGIA
jgi:hypothetical protein